MEYMKVKTILSRTKDTGWFGTSYNMNLYRGCTHGCIYCDSRSECYQNPDFGTIYAKQDALKILRDELRRKVRPGVVGTGSMSDPYNPREKDLLLSAHSLELLNAFEFGVAIATKSDLICRDIPVLQDIAKHSPVICKLTITCADDDTARKLEPYAPPSSRRFDALEKLCGAGLFSGILLMPLLPYINDTEENIRTIVTRARDCGARFIYPSFGVTQRAGQREYFHNALERLYPGMAARYMKRYGMDYHCAVPHAGTLYRNFAALCDEYGLLYKMPDIISASTQPYSSIQLSFFQ